MSCMNGPSGHIKNMKVKQLCNQKVSDLATAFRVWKLFGTFEGPTPSLNCFLPKTYVEIVMVDPKHKHTSFFIKSRTSSHCLA